MGSKNPRRYGRSFSRKKKGRATERNLTTILYELYPSINPRLILNLAFAEFTVPPGQNIFSQKKEQLFIPVKHIVTSSLDNNLKLGSTANFCHACVKGGTKYGDTCWGLIPKKSSHRLCGCNSGGWEGYGIYYGGYKKNNDGCGGQGGGFAGPKKEQSAKGKLGLGWFEDQNPLFVRATMVRTRQLLWLQP